VIAIFFLVLTVKANFTSLAITVTFKHLGGFAEKNEIAQLCDATIFNTDSMLEPKKVSQVGACFKVISE
jgi:hypothetical protein